MQVAINLEQYNAIDHCLFNGKIADPIAVKNVLRKSAENIAEVAAIYVKFCSVYGYLEDLVQHHLKQRSFPQIKQLIGKVRQNQLIRFSVAYLLAMDV